MSSVWVTRVVSFPVLPCWVDTFSSGHIASTTVTTNKILAILHQAVDELNVQLPRDKKLAKGEDTTLIGDGSVLDSLNLMTFLVAVEEKLSETGLEIALADEAAGSPDTTPLRTIGTLGKFILSRAAEKSSS